ncbi:MAG: diguanylate cyclase [Negativicutes bacterium]|nr:diguanylate cyclase [Negativicutes bacterium]
MKRSPVRSLTAKYIVALSLIAILALTAFVTLRQLIVGEQASAAIINVSGRQRMLTQKGVLLSFQLAVSVDPAQRVRLRADLTTLIRSMQDAHHAIIYGSPEFGVSGALSAEMRQMLFEPPVALDLKLLRYFNALSALVELADNDYTIYIPQLSVVVAAADELIAAQGAAVDQLQRESEVRVKKLERLETYVVLLTLLVLLLEALFIFRPAARAIEREQKYLAAANAELQRLSHQDWLTGIANRRFFDEFMERMWRQAARDGEPISLLIADIDFFKLFNDRYGHQAGDDCLRQVAGALKDQVGRAADFVARYGGEEFAVILPFTDLPGALNVAEKLRAAVEALQIEHWRSEKGAVTISVGVAMAMPGQGSDPQDLVLVADKALYRAKEKGRNRVEA